jgi:hypothetical protein
MRNKSIYVPCCNSLFPDVAIIIYIHTNTVALIKAVRPISSSAFQLTEFNNSKSLLNSCMKSKSPQITEARCLLPQGYKYNPMFSEQE